MQGYRSYNQKLRAAIICALVALVAVPAFAVTVTVKNEGTVDAVLRKWNGKTWEVVFPVASGETRKYTANSGDWVGLFHPTTSAELQKIQVSPPPSRNELTVAALAPPPPPPPTPTPVPGPGPIPSPTPGPIPTPVPPASSKIELVAVNNSMEALVLQYYKTGGWVTADPYVTKTTGDIRKQVDSGSYWRFATRATPAVQVKRLQVTSSDRLLEVSITDIPTSPGPPPPPPTPPGPVPGPSSSSVEVTFLNTTGETIKLVQVISAGPGSKNSSHNEVFRLSNRYQQKMLAKPGDHYEMRLASNNALMGTYLIPTQAKTYSITPLMLPKKGGTPVVVKPSPSPTPGPGPETTPAPSGRSGPREMMRRLLGR